MKVLGVTPSSNEVSWALVEGTRSNPSLVNLDSTKQKFPKTQSEAQILYNLHKFVLTFLENQAVDKVCILQAGNNKFGKASSMRIKAEAVFQLACAEHNIPVELVPPQTLRAQEKKFQADAGGTPESVFNNGSDFRPKPWKDTVMIAWTGLNA